jgi:hypothetical protein
MLPVAAMKPSAASTDGATARTGREVHALARRVHRTAALEQVPDTDHVATRFVRAA